MVPKILDKDYNIHIKKVCKLAEINEQVFGKNSAKKRSVNWYYTKYELITSHVERSTLATLLSGELPPELIASIGGWSQQ